MSMRMPLLGLAMMSLLVVGSIGVSFASVPDAELGDVSYLTVCSNQFDAANQMSSNMAQYDRNAYGVVSSTAKYVSATDSSTLDVYDNTGFYALINNGMHSDNRCTGPSGSNVVGDPPVIEVITQTNSVQINTPITFTATASDTEDGDSTVDIVWTSNPAGLTGTGGSVSWTPAATGLYTITATITDNDNNSVYDIHQITVDRGDPPTVDITTSATTAQVNTPITLTASASDTEDGDSTADIVWTSNPAGLTGTGGSVSWTPAATGLYTITATITDSDGNSVYDTHQITVDRGDPPTVDITTSATTAQVNTPITLTASASDTEDGDSTADIVWTSNPAGLTGTGGSVSWTPAATGLYTITATITDSDGNSVYDTHQITVDRGDPPTVDITTSATTAQVNTPITLTASASDTEDGDSTVDIVWTSNPAGLTGTGGSVSWTPAATGLYTITATITDNDNNSVYDIHQITVDRGDPPTVDITTSATTAQVNTPITLTASASDTEDGDSTADIVWTSNPAGLTGTGGSVSWTPAATGLYTITATITDSDGNPAYDTRMITVDRGDPPTVTIGPSATTAKVDTQITLTATASDTEDGDSAAGIVWTSSPAGVTGTGNFVTWTPQNVGSYTITATITDSDGNPAYDTRMITVDSGNTPSIDITTRTTTVLLGKSITLEATTNDVEDANLNSDIVWISDPLGLADTGGSVTWTPTQTGEYSITATITDSDGNSASDMHTITVDRGDPPTVDITTRAITAQVNQPIMLTATASDPEDGDSSARIVWSSNPTGLADTGSSVTWTPTQIGEYEITAIIVDTTGNSASDAFTITVDNGDPPTVTIGTTDTTAQVNVPITFTATANDVEDGDSSADIVWTSNPAGLADTGSSVTWTPAAAGAFTIIATITDDDGNSVDATHRITVELGDAPEEETDMKNPLYQQPPKSSDTFTSRVVLAYENSITTSTRSAIDTSIEMWEKLNQQLDLVVEDKPSADATNYEYYKQPVSIISLSFLDYLPDDRVGDYYTEYYNYADGKEFISHTIRVQLGWDDCNGAYQPFHNDAISDTLEHEIGHFLQLGHTTEEGHLMWSPYPDAVPIDEFNDLGWTIPPDTSYSNPKTIVGKALEPQLIKLEADYETHKRAYDAATSVADRNKYAGMINDVVAELNPLIGEYNCVESPRS